MAAWKVGYLPRSILNYWWQTVRKYSLNLFNHASGSSTVVLVQKEKNWWNENKIKSQPISIFFIINNSNCLKSEKWFHCNKWALSSPQLLLVAWDNKEIIKWSYSLYCGRWNSVERGCMKFFKAPYHLLGSSFRIWSLVGWWVTSNNSATWRARWKGFQFQGR